MKMAAEDSMNIGTLFHCSKKAGIELRSRHPLEISTDQMSVPAGFSIVENRNMHISI